MTANAPDGSAAATSASSGYRALAIGCGTTVLLLAVSAGYLGETRYLPHRIFPVADALVYAEGASGQWPASSAFPLSHAYLLGLRLVGAATAWANAAGGLSLQPLVVLGWAQAVVVAVGVGAAVGASALAAPAVALIGGALVVMYGPLLFFQGVGVPVAVATGLGGVCLALLIVYFLCDRWSVLPPAGLMLGILVDLRPHFAFVLIAMVGIISLRSPLGRRRGIRHALLMLIVAAATLLLVAVATGGSGGSAALPVRSSIGLNLYIGNHPGANGTYQKIAGLNNEPSRFLESSTTFADSATGRALSALEVNLFWARRAGAFALRSPLAAAALWARKAQHLVSGREFPVNYDYPVQRGQSRLLRLMPVHFGILGPLAVAGLFLASGPLWLIVRLWFLAYGSSMLVFFVCSDHRVPLVVGASLLAGAALARIYSLLLAGRWFRYGVALAVVAFLGGVAATDPIRWSHQQTYLQMAQMAERSGDLGLAVRAAREAVSEQPGFVPGLAYLARLFSAEHRLDSAVVLYDQALRWAPGERKLLEALADACQRLGNSRLAHDRAAHLCRRASSGDGPHAGRSDGGQR